MLEGNGLQNLQEDRPGDIMPPAAKNENIAVINTGSIGMELTEITLENGLKVYLVEDHTRPLVFGSVVVKAGSKYDPADATGIAHYLEHMLFKGTAMMGTTDFVAEKTYLDKIDALYEKLGQAEKEDERKAIQDEIHENSLEASKFAIPNEFSSLIDRIGGTGLNAFTTEEMIVYHNSFPPHQIDRWLRLYAGRFQDPVFRLFQSELETVYEEKNRASDNFGYQVFREYNRNFYKKHPYGQRDILGETEHLKNPSLQKMRKYYSDYYVPNNMALILIGDFRPEFAVQKIRDEFGSMIKGDVPKLPEYKEDPFRGREFVSKRLSPVKIGVIGFRTVPNGHPDQAAIDVCSYLLSNENQTGSVDELIFDKKLMAAGVESDIKNDYGGLHVYFVPKIARQSLKKAEGLVDAAIEKMSSGQFTHGDISVAKINLKKAFIQDHESAGGRAMEVAETFASGEKWKDHADYLAVMDSLKYEDLMKVASTYFGKDRLVFWSKTGFAKKEKLPEPDYDVPLSNSQGQSSFANMLDQISPMAPTRRFVAVGSDVQSVKFHDHLVLYYTQNPVNQLFEFEMELCKGSDQDPMLELAARYLELCGSGDETNKVFRNLLSGLGSTYRIEDNGNSMILHIDGFDKNLDVVLNQVSRFLFNPKMDEDILKQVIDEIRADRQIESRDPQAIGEILNEYITYGANSEYLSRLGLKEMKDLASSGVDSSFKAAMTQACTFRYSGRIPKEQVIEKINKYFARDIQIRQEAPQFVARPKEKPQSNAVIFLQNKKARQSQIYIYQNLGPEAAPEMANRKAFNKYFGSDMSSLVFQEIRELRSLAYAAYAEALDPETENDDVVMTVYAGTQSDKSNSAVEVLMDLITEMPQYEERTPAVRNALVNSVTSGFPAFRNLNATLASWHRMGYLGDPAKAALMHFLELKFEDITSYYDKYINDNPYVLGIAGNRKYLELQDLEKYGEIRQVKLKEIMNE